MKKTILSAVIALGAFIFVGCGSQSNNQKEQTMENETKSGMVDKVLTKEEQDALTPDLVMHELLEGNKRFMKNNLTARDYPAQVKKTADGQYPEAIILSCVDSRVPVEYVFDRGIGDLFVARVAGNFVNEDILGSMEFACKVSGSKLIMVLGHESCGAVKSAVDDVKLGNITPMLAKIRPAVEAVEYEGDRTSKNAEFVHMVCETNVRQTIDQIRTDSPVLKEMEDNGEIKIVGAVYSLENGEVTMLN
jgi:carbonic anhydrase